MRPHSEVQSDRHLGRTLFQSTAVAVPGCIPTCGIKRRWRAEKSGRELSPGPDCARTRTSEFLPPELGQNTFPLLKPPGLWYCYADPSRLILNCSLSFSNNCCNQSNSYSLLFSMCQALCQGLYRNLISPTILWGRYWSSPPYFYIGKLKLGYFG